MRGDEFLAREGIVEVDFLKLDVEGAEHLVLRGFDRLLRERRVRFVQFEYGRVNILTRFLLKDFHQLFAAHGYLVGKIYPDHVDIRDYDLGDEDFLGRGAGTSSATPSRLPGSETAVSVPSWNCRIRVLLLAGPSSYMCRRRFAARFI
jgi:methyltransferase FkbM-like protein